MEAELTAWKANVYDIVRKMEGLPGGAKEKFLSNIEDLHILITEMDDRIDQIRENCTPETGIDDIRTDREKFDKAKASLRVAAGSGCRRFWRLILHFNRSHHSGISNPGAGK
jgi:hypothetical protein